MSQSDLYQLLYDLFTSAVPVLVLTTIAAGVVYKFMMSIVSSIFSFIMAKSDLLGVGTTVIYAGKKCQVKQIGFRKIRLLCDNEIHMIPTDSWKSLTVIEPGL